MSFLCCCFKRRLQEAEKNASFISGNGDAPYNQPKDNDSDDNSVQTVIIGVQPTPDYQLALDTDTYEPPDHLLLTTQELFQKHQN